MSTVAKYLGLVMVLGACGQQYHIDLTDPNKPADTSVEPFTPFDASPNGVGPGKDADGNPIGGTPAGGYPNSPTGGTDPTSGNPTGGTPTNPTGGTPTNPTGGTPTNPTGGTPTNPTGGTPTNPTGGTPTNPTGGTPTNPTGGTPTNPTGGTPTNPTGGTPTNPTGGTPTNPTTPGNPVVPPGGEVCEPFSGGTSTPISSVGPQINGKLYAGIPFTYDTVNGQSVRRRIPSVNDFFKRDSAGRDMYMQPTTLFFSDINAPQRPFDKGFFNISGNVIKDPLTSETLTEQFAMSLGSNIKLDDSDATGQYQFAVLSDDGSNFYLDNNHSSVFIQNDTEHPPALRCATETVYLNKNTRLPFRLDYYQGPRYHIALVMLWRKIPEGSSPSALDDEKCMPDMYRLLTTAQQDKYNVWQDSTSKEYDKLLARGWKVLKPGNYQLSEGSIPPPDKCIKK